MMDDKTEHRATAVTTHRSGIVDRVELAVNAAMQEPKYPMQGSLYFVGAMLLQLATVGAGMAAIVLVIALFAGAF